MLENATQSEEARCLWAQRFREDKLVSSVFRRNTYTIQYVASITQEKQFSTSMIKQDTQIVFLDEWSENSLQSDMAKVVLQGGYMPKSTKHKDATFVLNNSPYYITTNSLPSLGAEDDNVKRRIKAFETTSLPSTSPNVER